MKKKYETPRKTRNYNFKFDIDLQELIETQPNKSKFMNELVRKEKERLERIERIKARQELKTGKHEHRTKSCICNQIPQIHKDTRHVRAGERLSGYMGEYHETQAGKVCRIPERTTCPNECKNLLRHAESRAKPIQRRNRFTQRI